ncbi:hypothetical protein JCM33374_g3075 [Metschnikowia sp. JCM 33374]|nr:hypothetical protein JCM33374_g3075 [Metschnikowia sp. JCM 33374]
MNAFPNEQLKAKEVPLPGKEDVQANKPDGQSIKSLNMNPHVQPKAELGCQTESISETQLNNSKVSRPGDGTENRTSTTPTFTLQSNEPQTSTQVPQATSQSEFTQPRTSEATTAQSESQGEDTTESEDSCTELSYSETAKLEAPKTKTETSSAVAGHDSSSDPSSIMQEIERKARTISLVGGPSSKGSSATDNVSSEETVKTEFASEATKVSTTTPLAPNPEPSTCPGIKKHPNLDFSGLSENPVFSILETSTPKLGMNPPVFKFPLSFGKPGPSLSIPEKSDLQKPGNQASTLKSDVYEQSCQKPDPTRSQKADIKSPQKPIAGKEVANSDFKYGSNSCTKIDIESLPSSLSIYEAREYFPWIGLFHQQGIYFHPKFAYLALVFNEIGHWNKDQVLLLASNDELDAQIKWEIRVALFFRKQNPSQHADILHNLSSIPKDEALMIIALHSAKDAHEVILAPSPDSDLTDLTTEATIDKVKLWAKSSAGFIKEKVEEAATRCDAILNSLHEAKISEKDVWSNVNDADQILLADLVKARVLIWQLDTLLPYFSPHTGLVHLKTTRWDPLPKESVRSHSLVEHVPLLNDFKKTGFDPSFSLSRQYENLQKFSSHVDLVVDVKGEPRPVIFNSVESPERCIPFELFFSEDQKTQPANFMRSISTRQSAFFFVAPPTPLNHKGTCYSIEGIVNPNYLLHNYGNFKSDPLTLSLSKFADFCSVDNFIKKLHSSLRPLTRRPIFEAPKPT